MAEGLEQRCIISGIGQSELGRRLTRGVPALTLDAIGEAGPTPADIDGVVSWPAARTGPEASHLRSLRGEAGERQVPEAKVAAVSAGAGPSPRACCLERSSKVTVNARNT